jgi:glucose-1-phosphate adenylyltransferase
MNGVTVSEGAEIRNAIVDENVTVGPGARIVAGAGTGDGPFPVSENGIVVVGRNQKVVNT